MDSCAAIIFIKKRDISSKKSGKRDQGKKRNFPPESGIVDVYGTGLPLLLPPPSFHVYVEPEHEHNTVFSVPCKTGFCAACVGYDELTGSAEDATSIAADICAVMPDCGL